MEDFDNSRDFLQQGLLYGYKKYSIYMGFTLKDRIDGALLEEAVNKALDRCPYYRLSIDCNEYDISTSYCYDHYKVHESVERKPYLENRTGYLFNVQYFKDKLYFEFDHFLTDGRGIFLFITEILATYFNLFYKNDFEEKYLTTDPMYDVQSICNKYIGKDFDYTKNEIRKVCSSDLENSVKKFELNYKQLKAYAKSRRVRNIAVMLTILVRAYQHTYSELINPIYYGYTVDMRRYIGNNNALYNSSSLAIDNASASQNIQFDELLFTINKNLNTMLDSEYLSRIIAKEYELVNSINSRDTSLKKKSRICDIILRQNNKCDLWISWVGDLFYGGDQRMSEYIGIDEINLTPMISAYDVICLAIGDKLSLLVNCSEKKNIFFDEIEKECKSINLDVIRL